jgi:LysM repeat protein
LRCTFDGKERLIRYPSHARAAAEPELLDTQRRRRDPERSGPPRRARRRRSSTPWLQRNALSVAAVSMLVALLGLGFGLVQMMNRPEATPGLVSVAQAESPTTANNAVMLNAASLGTGVQVADGPVAASFAAPVNAVTRPIQANAKVLAPNYTIAAGDTLGQIAVRFSTTVERIQAFNNLNDPRALRIGTPLIIPPPL